MAIKIEFLSKISAFLKGTDNMGDALDGVADSLDDVARDAQRAGDKTGDAFEDAARDTKRAGDKIGDSLSDGTKEAEQSVDRLERSFKDLADTARRESDQAGDAMKREFDSSTDAAKRDLNELGDEAKQNLSETLSSFDGSVSSMADGIQGTLGGVISNIGPMGAAAAVGLALVTAEFQRGSERAAEMKEQAGELAQQIIEAGGDIRKVPMSDVLQEWGLQLSGTSEAWDIFGDKSQTNLEALSDGAKAAGLDLADMFSALANSDPARAADIMDDLSVKLAKVNDEITRHNGARLGGTKIAEEAREEKAAIEDALQVMEDRTGMNREATSSARELGDALAQARAEQEAETAAVQARTDVANALQSALDEGVDSWEEYMGAEGKVADPSAYMAAMQARIDATTNFNANVQTLADATGLTMEEAQAVLNQGVDFAPMLASIVGGGQASMEKYAALIQQIVGGGQEIADGNPLTITAKSDTKGARADLNQTTAEKRTAGIGAQAHTKGAAAELEQVRAKKRTARITAQAVTGGANAQLARAARTRTAFLRAVAQTHAAERQLDQLARPRTTIITAEVRQREGRKL